MSTRVLASRVKEVFSVELPVKAAAAIVFIWIACFADYFLTVLQVSHGGLELNPLLAPFFQHFEYEKALIVKIALTFPGICILSFFYKHPFVMRAIRAILVVYACLLVYHALNILVLG